MLREKHKNERKQQILEAARRLIQKDGVPGMSMRELAIEAQVRGHELFAGLRPLILMRGCSTEPTVSSDVAQPMIDED